MSVKQTIVAPSLAAQRETCAACGGVLLPDQRYCLNCGWRRTDSRVPYAELLGGEAPDATGGAPGRPGAASAAAVSGAGWSPVVAMVGVGVVTLVLGVGVLIGRSVSGSPRRASAPQVITVGGTSASGQSAPGAGAAFTGDWPAGKDGYTVALQSLSKDQTQPTAVAAAKTAALTKGAPGVGALDSDTYPSLDGGQYIVYSGVYKTQAEASKALKALKAKFPQAKVIHVSKTASDGGSTGPAKTISRDQLKKLNSTSGSDYFKKSQKLPKKIAIPGPPPAKDNKPAGGGSGGGQTIG